MYLFFTLFGLIFVIGLSIVLNYIYSVFSINKVTKFLNPTENTIFNKISISLIPILIWSYIELPMLGDNFYFIIGLILNIFLNCSIVYIIKYGYSMLSEDENEIVNVISIIIATIYGYVINYICLLIGREGELKSSLIGILVITIFYIVIKIHPPKSDFFKVRPQK